MQYYNLRFENVDNIGIIFLNRPHRLNALTKELLLELNDLFEEIELEPSVKAIIIRGSGRKAFSTGDDLVDVKGFDNIAYGGLLRLGHKVFRKIVDFEKIVLACIEGFAMGGGLELALACDFRIASENAVFSFPEVGLGVPPGWGGTQRLTRIIGEAKAKELILTCDSIDAFEAYEMGLVNKVVPVDELMNEATILAQKIISKAPLAVRFSKRLINEAFNAHQHLTLDYEILSTQLCHTTKDFEESMLAYEEKREPVFIGK